MSIYPCDLHHQRIVGPLGAIYAALLYGSSRYDRRLRVCSGCLDSLLQVHGSRWTLVDGDGASEGDFLCAGCSSELGPEQGRTAFFATAYRKGSDRQDYFAYYCHGCAFQLASSLGVDFDIAA